MTTTTHTITSKAQSFYIAYAPEAGIWSYGGCFEEAVNSLAEELRSLGVKPDSELATKGNRDAVV